MNRQRVRDAGEEAVKWDQKGGGTHVLPRIVSAINNMRATLGALKRTLGAFSALVSATFNLLAKGAQEEDGLSNFYL